jgi:hypothetical protein
LAVMIRRRGRGSQGRPLAVRLRGLDVCHSVGAAVRLRGRNHSEQSVYAACLRRVKPNGSQHESRTIDAKLLVQSRDPRQARKRSLDIGNSPRCMSPSPASSRQPSLRAMSRLRSSAALASSPAAGFIFTCLMAA